MTIWGEVTLQHLLQLADELGLTIIEHRGEHPGGYRHGDAVIRLEPGMSRRTTRSVLAHEIGHHILGHRPTPDPQVRARQERAANEWAARCLIRPDAYAEVEQLHEGHLAPMAFELDVAPELVTAYRATLSRIGDAVYVRPRMGAGQWMHREQVA